MQNEFVNTPESIFLLYGETFYLVPSAEDDLKPRQEQQKVGTSPAIAPTSKPIAEKPVSAPSEIKTPVTSPVETPIPAMKPGIQWRTKPAAKMMFIMQQVELKDPVLSDLLKKIVEAIGIPFEAAGFGIIDGPVNLAEFESMPNRYGVVFDGDLWRSPNMATTFGDKEVFFSMRLAYLQNDAESKRQLWDYLKNLKQLLT